MWQGRQSPWLVGVALAAALCGAAQAETESGWARSSRYTLVAGPRGAGATTQAVYIVDNLNQILFLCEYARGKSFEVVRPVDLLLPVAKLLNQRLPKAAPAADLTPGYALATGIRGTTPNAHTLYLVDDVNEVVLVYEYDARSHQLKARVPCNLRKAARELLAVRRKLAGTPRTHPG